MSENLSQKQIDELVVDFLCADKFGSRKKYDAVDDLARLLFIARELAGAKKLPLHRNNAPKGEIAFEAFLKVGADILYAECQELTWQDWRSFYGAILCERRRLYGDTMVRMRKRPALEVWDDATRGRMSYAELKAKHPHLSRSYLYALIKKANARK